MLPPEPLTSPDTVEGEASASSYLNLGGGDAVALNPSLAAPVPVGALVPRVATVNVNHADPVHRLPCELPTIVGMPRDVHDDPIHRLMEVFDLNGVTLRAKPLGVSGGVGGGVEVDFKMHLALSFICSLGVALKQYRSLETGETA